MTKISTDPNFLASTTTYIYIWNELKLELCWHPNTCSLFSPGVAAVITHLYLHQFRIYEMLVM